MSHEEMLLSNKAAKGTSKLRIYIILIHMEI